MSESGEWIEWRGGPCPVPAGTMIDIRDGDGFEWNGFPALKAPVNTDAMWRHAPREVALDNQVTAYRVVKP